MPPSRAHPGTGSRWFTSADLREHSPSEPIRPLAVVADDHRSIASAVTKSLPGNALSPITSLELLARVVHAVVPLVLIADLDFEGALALDVLERHLDTHPALAVIAYTGHDTAVMREMVRRAGILRFVSKLDALEALLAAVVAAGEELNVGGVAFADPVSPSQALPGRRKKHDAGPLIRWAVSSGFKPSAIARVADVSSQAVAHHVRRMKNA